MMRVLMLTVLLMMAPVTGVEASFDHQIWDRLLGEHVQLINQGQASQVDYRGMAVDEEKLDQYLDALGAVSRASFAQWSQEEQLAFLINAYNAWTVKLILSKYPDLESIKDLGSLFRSPWKKQFIPLFGEQLSLDDIEHGLIRESGRYNEPRIHFAVNCASIGCPALANHAYAGAALDAQLERVTGLFLADRTRNRLVDGRLQVSSIFKWYREDFERGWQGVDSLPTFFFRYRQSLGLDRQQADAVVAGKVPITFFDYDWRLNDVR